jgi:cytochrome c-type biogenesis protein CcmH/NrfG
MTLPDDDNSNPKRKSKLSRQSRIIVAVIVALIFIVPIGLYIWWVMGESAFIRRALEAGCTIEVYNQWGMVSRFQCPPGVTLK